MPALSLEDFLGVVDDFERTQYEILARLQRVREAFDENRIYPHLSDLVELDRSLDAILERTDDLKQSLSRRIESIDWDEQEVVYEDPELNDQQVEQIEELIRWARPHVQDTIEEGRAIYEYVDERIDVETVGLLPSYVNEGYLMIPEPADDGLHVIRYGVSLYTGPDQKYRSLKTSFVKTVPLWSVASTPEELKLELVDEIDDLPNPATYFFNTEVPYPFEPTILPVSKRKFLRHLYGSDRNE